MIEFKTVEDLINTANALGIDYYGETNYHIILIGINGHGSVVQIENKRYKKKASTMKDFANHLRQMGRDSLKIDLNNLLDITKHY